MKNMFFISIKKASKCLYSRRVGKNGIRIFGYSVKLTLFKKEII